MLKWMEVLLRRRMTSIYTQIRLGNMESTPPYKTTDTSTVPRMRAVGQNSILQIHRGFSLLYFSVYIKHGVGGCKRCCDIGVWMSYSIPYWKQNARRPGRSTSNDQVRSICQDIFRTGSIPISAGPMVEWVFLYYPQQIRKPNINWLLFLTVLPYLLRTSKQSMIP